MYNNIMSVKKAFIITVVFSLFMSACATKPAFDALFPTVQIEKAEESDVRPFGSDFSENPYMEPRTLLRGKLNEFFIVKISFNLPADSKISIIAAATSPDGKEAAKVYDQYSFIDFWEVNTSTESEAGSEVGKKISSINRSCIPSFNFLQKAGQSILFVPIVSRSPVIPRPAKIFIQVSADQNGTFTYEYMLE